MIRAVVTVLVLLVQHTCRGLQARPRFLRLLRPSSSRSSSAGSSTVEDALDEFHRTLGASPFDAMHAARLHLDLVLQLVRSDVQDRDGDDGSEVHAFPPSYWAAIEYVTTTVTLLKEGGHPLHAAANMVAKKEGLPQVSRTVRTAMNARRLMSAREIVEVRICEPRTSPRAPLFLTPSPPPPPAADQAQGGAGAVAAHDAVGGLPQLRGRQR